MVEFPRKKRKFRRRILGMLKTKWRWGKSLRVHRVLFAQPLGEKICKKVKIDGFSLTFCQSIPGHFIPLGSRVS